MAAQCCCCKGPGAEAAPARPPPEPPPALDVASASSAQLFRLRHLQLGLELRPEARELAGCLVLELCALRPAPRALVLDAHPALRLHSAAFRRAPAAATEPPCAFAFAAAEPGPAPPPPLPAFPDAPGAEPACCPLAFRVDPFTDYGSSLTVTLPPELQAHQPFQVILRYTSTDAPAIWWLDPELTYGNAKPFVFTQGHSVCNRSFFPCFDTPAVKCTYSAVVKAPSGVQVLMSATQSTYVEEEGVYRFHMEHPVPAYLVALVAGDLQPADIGPRSRVWAEPCLLPTATSKLSGAVEQWLSAAERLYGPYMWGRYDIVFLPPSFPIVAMENPCLTFIISSILESDEFLVIDVIHEVAHSWFGNAVTNATWEEMWLSEGLATYAQRRITTETYGAAFTCLETAFRLDALHRQMKLLGEDSPVSKLQVKLEPGVNPSHLMNLFTYEKGYCFVYYLSQLCGEPQRFDDFLRAYVEKYKFTSVVAQDLLDSFLSFFPELKEQSVDCRAGRYLPCRAGVRALAQRHGPTAGRARPVSGIQPDPAGRGPLPAVDCGASGPGSRLSQCHRHLQVEDLPDSALPGPAPRWVPAAPGGGDEPVQVLLLPAGLDERRDPDPLAADRGPQRLLPRPPPGPAVPREPDVPHVHHPAVRGPLHRRTQVLRPGGVLPDTGPTAPQPAQDHPADPVPGPGPRRRAWRGAGQGRGGLGGGRRHAGPAARGRGPQQHHFSQGRQRVCLALTSQTPRLCLRGPGLP